MTSTQELEAFRADVIAWLNANFPSSLAHRGVEIMVTEGASDFDADTQEWIRRLGEKGWGAPTWPTEYGGAGLNQQQARIVAEEMGNAGAFNPMPSLAGMGITMVGPTILEYGTDEQKQRHLPGMANGSVRWCLGYSEPNAGSDLASLQTKAVDNGDHWVINGQKTWTSGADISQWAGVLVRTDTEVAKRKGISLVMLPMDQEGIRTRPIKLISGASPFCETFFTDAVAEKRDLLGDLNDGWSVGKRLLQHERASQTSAVGGGGSSSGGGLAALAKEYVGTDEQGRLADPDLRLRLADQMMSAKAHSLTLRRIADEAKGNAKVTAAASILKNSATDVGQARAELTLEIMGNSGMAWDGDAFSENEKNSVRGWLWGKAVSIYGGSREIQKNIIAKNILGLPETTQKG